MCCLVATVIHVQSVRSQIVCVCVFVCACVYAHILHNMETPVGQKTERKIGKAVDAACQRKSSPCDILGTCAIGSSVVH